MAGAKEKREYCFKILVVGDCAVGKTALIGRYTKGSFCHQYRVTIGADFALKVFEFDEHTTITIQLWDIGGQEHSPKLCRAYYQHASAALVVFDVTRTKTLKSISSWIDAIYGTLELGDELDFPIILLANKNDLEWDASLTTELLDSLCNNNTIHSWFATSAKSEQSIDDAITVIVESLLSRKDCCKQEIVCVTCQCKAPSNHYNGIIHLTASCDKTSSSRFCLGCSSPLS